MPTRRFIAKHGLDNNNQTITNVASPVNSTDVVIKSVTDGLLIFTQAAFNAANSANGSQAQTTFDIATSAASNTVYLQGVDLSQNSRIGTLESNTVYVTGVDVSQNTRISTLESNTVYVTGVDVSQNTRISTLESNTAHLAGVDVSQNTRISTLESNTAYLSGVDITQNTNITNVNNWLSSNVAYFIGVDVQQNTDIVTANTKMKSYVDDQVNYINSINVTQNTNISAVSNVAQNAYNTANLKFNTSGGNITGPVTISSNLVITGNLTVSGNVTTVSANNLIVTDNMIYLNDGNQVTNPDLGFSGNYNDGTYRHAGFFRDASDGYWKVYDQYLPEPDASPYIDTSNSSFRIADFQANNVTFGKITTSSSVVVSNLNADYLDGQHGSYYAVASEQSGINTTQNTNITGASTLAQAAFNQANTDYTTVVTSAGSYGGTTAIPVVTVASNGRITAISTSSITAGATISDDNTSNANRYVMLGIATSGSYITANTSSTKLTFNPSTGTLSATAFSGSGASLTSLTAGNLSGTIPSVVLGNSSLYIGTTAIALNRSSASQSLTGVSIDGSAGSVAASALTGTTLASGVTGSSLTSVGTITSGTWSGSFGAVSGANLTGLTAGNLSGTIPSAVLGNSTAYVGTTAIALNRASASQTLTGVSIDGSAGTLGGLSKSQLWNNSGQNHSTYTSFSGPTDFGNWFVHQDAAVTDGPGGNYQYYVSNYGLGNDYAYSLYAMQTAINRYGYGSPYLNIRFKENGTWQAWSKIYAGYADSAGALTTGNNYQVNSLGVGTAASGTAGEIRATNNITAYYSDDRLKTRLGNIENALDKIRSLQGFYYEANDLAQSMGYKPVREVGLSAQDTQQSMPEIVKPAPIDDKYLTVQYERYAPFIVEAIKELADQIDEIKKHLGI